MIWGALVALAIVLSGMGAASAQSAEEPPGPLGALVPEGFGADSIGGVGGEVLWVTNLNDSGPGSFREAATAEVPRIVRFKVGGIIPMEDTIRVLHGRITIDGASAAEYGGITLFGHGISFEGLECRDVIVRHLRVRRSDEGRDCMTVKEGAHRVLIDHCSVSWADDENMGINKGHYVTVQWCIIAEGLIEGDHAEGAHPCGMLVAHGANHVTVHHNYFAGNAIRNPLFHGVGGSGSGGVWPGCKPGEEWALFMPVATFDVRNNLVYNFTSGTELAQGLQVNLVNNYYKYGPDDFPLVYPPKTGRGLPVHLMVKTYYPGSEQPKAYCSGNIGPRRPDQTVDDWELVYVGGVANEGDWGSDPDHRSDCPFLVGPVETQPAEEAAELVLESAGAFPRDEVDQRLIEEYRQGTGHMGKGFLEWKAAHGL